jgi:hypothetical protein
MAETIAVLGVVSGTTSLAAILANMASNLWNAAEAIKIINEETKFVKSEVTDLVPVSSQSLNHLAKTWKVLKTFLTPRRMQVSRWPMPLGLIQQTYNPSSTILRQYTMSLTNISILKGLPNTWISSRP